METSVKQRIKELIDKRSESVYAFAKQINVAQTTLSEYLNNGKKVSFTIIRAILEAFPDVSADWLLRGIEPSASNDLPLLDREESGNTMLLKADITRLTMENEKLLHKVEQVTRERDYAIKERDQLMLENRAINRRVDKLIDILYQDPSSRISIAPDGRVPYADSTMVG